MDEEASVAGSSSSTSTTSAAAAANGRQVKATHNPWVLKCHRDHLSKLQKRSSTHAQKEKETHTQSEFRFLFIDIGIGQEIISPLFGFELNTCVTYFHPFVLIDNNVVQSLGNIL